MNRLLLLALTSLAALSASAGAGYLAVIGPAPLRFEGRARPTPRAIAMLPPLLMQDPVTPAPPTNVVALATTNPPPPTVTPPAVTNTALVTTITVTNPPIVLLPAPIPPATGPLLSPMFDPNDPNSLLTAQMLIRYFRPVGTNGAGTSVIGPLFLPPPPAPPPASKATYSTPTP